jgi:hypothetical protein
MLLHLFLGFGSSVMQQEIFLHLSPHFGASMKKRKMVHLSLGCYGAVTLVTWALEMLLAMVVSSHQRRANLPTQDDSR